MVWDLRKSVGVYVESKSLVRGFSKMKLVIDAFGVEKRIHCDWGGQWT